jgi:hypothetical protein
MPPTCFSGDTYRSSVRSINSRCGPETTVDKPWTPKDVIVALSENHDSIARSALPPEVAPTIAEMTADKQDNDGEFLDVEAPVLRPSRHDPT